MNYSVPEIPTRTGPTPNRPCQTLTTNLPGSRWECPAPWRCCSLSPTGEHFFASWPSKARGRSGLLSVLPSCGVSFLPSVSTPFAVHGPPLRPCHGPRRVSGNFGPGMEGLWPWRRDGYPLTKSFQWETVVFEVTSVPLSWSCTSTRKRVSGVRSCCILACWMTRMRFGG